MWQVYITKNVGMYAGEVSDESGHLGYCWMHHFKCHSARSCHTWAKGGL